MKMVWTGCARGCLWITLGLVSVATASHPIAAQTQPGSAPEAREQSEADDETAPLPFAVSEYGAEWLVRDTNEDGIADYALRLDEDGDKFREAVDYNYDGRMDDFYYYSNGVLAREEIDTNYDDRVDLWVFLHRGVYIERYMRDVDFDGVVDEERSFAE